MNHVKAKLRQYTAALLVIVMVFSQYGTSYAQGSGGSGFQVMSNATPSKAEKETETPAIPDTEEEAKPNTEPNTETEPNTDNEIDNYYK